MATTSDKLLPLWTGPQDLDWPPEPPYASGHQINSNQIKSIQTRPSQNVVSHGLKQNQLGKTHPIMSLGNSRG
jgi:hypothetical protein